jgi:peptidoglycan/LPS O-acetylase OafA/YrhL
MKKQNVPERTERKRDRLLFFDILRIVFVAVIVYDHSQYALVPWFNSLLFTSGNLPFNIYSAGLQGWAVFGMIFISGAVLEYNYQGINRFWNYSGFLFKRFIRLYPAFWMSLLFGLLLNVILTLPVAAEVIKNNFFAIVFEYTGFYVILGNGPGFINNMGWFIAAIVCLYFLYPYLTEFIREYRITAILVLLVITFAIRSFLLTNSGMIPKVFPLWFPVCNLFEFGLGIYLIQADWYPKTVNTSRVIRKLSDLSFYVFVFHTVVLAPLLVVMKTNADLSHAVNLLVSGQSDLQLTMYYILAMCLVLVASWTAMIIDDHVQQKIQNTGYAKSVVLFGNGKNQS